MEDKLYENNDLLDFSREDEETLLNRYLTFNIGEEIYGFEIMYVTEIIGIQKITKVPNISNYIKGIINLRGIIYPVIEIRNRFGIEAVPYTERTCIVLVRSRNMGVGMIVDNVSEVMRIDVDKIFPQPQTYKGSKSKYIKSIAKLGTEVKILLDLEKLLFEDLNQNIELN
jgi:purine-binding chemotaxis protein CheW